MVPNCTFVFQDFVSSGGSCAGAVLNQRGEQRWTAAPLDSKRLMKCVQEVIMKACKFTQAQAAAYGMHSARHTLAEVAKWGVEGSCRNEIGRWSSSVAQLPSLRPRDSAVQKPQLARVDDGRSLRPGRPDTTSGCDPATAVGGHAHRRGGPWRRSRRQMPGAGKRRLAQDSEIQTLGRRTR